MTHLPARPTVSVALCTYNGARFITEQVTSILNQTVPADELVVYDDASSDDTISRIQTAWDTARSEHPATTPILRIVVNQQRLGIAANFGCAMSACRGEFIVLSDQDDRWHPDRLTRGLARMHAEPKLLLLHGNARLINAEGRALGATLFDALRVTVAELEAIAAGHALDVALYRNLVTGATTLFRRSLLQAALPIPLHWLHDEWLGVIAAALGAARVETEPLIDYRQHGANQIGAREAALIDEIKQAVAPRGEWHTRRVARAIELVTRLVELGSAVPAPALALANEKVEHHRARAGLSSSRLQRVLPVMREWSTGGYRRFGRGARGAIKDVLEGP